MPDTAHYYAAFMQKIAQHIDAWCESINNDELPRSSYQENALISLIPD